MSSRSAGRDVDHLNNRADYSLDLHSIIRFWQLQLRNISTLVNGLVVQEAANDGLAQQM